MTKAMTAPGAEHEARLQEKDREIEVVFDRIKAMRRGQAAKEKAVEALEGRIEHLLRAAQERDEEITALKAERDEEITALKAERDEEITALKAERDEEITALKAERDEEITALKAERDEEITALKARLAEILCSNSWAVTGPLRVAKNLLSRVVMRLKPLPAVVGSEAAGADRTLPGKEAPLPAVVGSEAAGADRTLPGKEAPLPAVVGSEAAGADRTLPGKEADSRRVSVIIPVYNNLYGTKHCMESVLASLEENECKGTVTVINDGSTEEGVSEYLREIAAMGCVVLHNRKNYGFIRAVNYGIQNTHPQDDIVLLNSDTEVNGDWLDRLRRCAYHDGNIGTVTPFSNNAESCSFPSMFHENTLPAGVTAAAIDAALSNICGYDPVDLPTAVGFCMFIKRDCLDAVGAFDEFYYGRGYGADGDFSLRASQKGWRNVLCPNLFVFHEGGASLGLEKEERMRIAEKTIDTAHSHYWRDVATYRKIDPAKDIRLEAMLHLLRSSDKPVILHLTHGLGGGTDKHVFDLIDFLGDQAFGIIAQPSGPDTCVLVLDGRKKTLTLRFMRGQWRELIRLLTSLRVGKVHVHQGWRVPDWMVALPKRLGVPYDMSVHDYFCINGNPHLIDENGFFCSDQGTRDECCAIDEYPVPENLTVELFRERKERLFKDAHRVLVPSQYARDLIGRYFPDANYILADHHDRELAGLYPPVVVRPTYRDEKMRIAVLGNLGPHKGADILDYVAMQTEAECEFHLIGSAYRFLDAAIIQHGPYAEDDLPALIDGADPLLIWFPALWPETYSYTLSEALYSGRPVVAPDIGSFPERTRNRPYTYIEPWNKPKSDWIAFFRALKTTFQNETPRAHPWRDQPRFVFRYRRDYLSNHNEVSEKSSIE